MPTVRMYNSGGINLYVNPFQKNDSDLLYALNVDSYPYWAKSKRYGGTTFLGTADGSAVTSLSSWQKDDGSLYVYRTSGSALYYSIQGTGAWTLAGNGTVGAGSAITSAVLGNTLVVADGVGSTRHTTSGTSFTNTTLAPVATSLAQYQNRIYAAGTASVLFYSTTNDATNWNTSGTSDSSSFTIPGEGRLSSIFKASDRLVSTKTSGLMYKWDGYSLVDMSSKLGPTSPFSNAETEGYRFWLNRLGIYGYGGAKPELLSNSIQPFIYNDAGSAIAGGTFDTAPATVHKYDYLLAVGTVTEDILGQTVNKAVIKYDAQKNEFTIRQYPTLPTAMHSYKDINGVTQFIWGDSTGQVYKQSTNYSDNGTAIPVSMLYMTYFGAPEKEKEYDWIDLFFNPGCQAKVQVAISDVFRTDGLMWVELGDVSFGHVEYKFPSNSRGRMLFIRIYESSKDAPFTFYGYSVSADVIEN